MGCDITVHYFYSLVTRIFPDCETEGYECFVMDSAGYIVMCKHWVHADWHWKDAPEVETVHITQMEPEIADHMIDHGYLQRDECNNLYYVRSQTHFKVTFNATNHMDEQNAWYTAEAVPNSNIYIVKKQLESSVNIRTDFNDCVCGDESEISPPQCTRESTDSCECPCYKRAEFESCTNTYLGSSWLPCAKEVWIDMESAVDDSDSLQDYEWCDAVLCDTKTTRGECDLVAMCRWCDREKDGKELDVPYCGEYDECFFGQVGHPSPYGVDGGIPVVVIIAAVAAILVLGSVVGGVITYKALMAQRAAEARTRYAVLQLQTPTPQADAIGLQPQTPTPQPDAVQLQTPTPQSDAVQLQTPTPQTDAVQLQTPTPQTDAVQLQTPTPQTDAVQLQTPTPQTDAVQLQTPTPQADAVQLQTPTPQTDAV